MTLNEIQELSSEGFPRDFAVRPVLDGFTDNPTYNWPVKKILGFERNPDMSLKLRGERVIVYLPGKQHQLIKTKFKEVGYSGGPETIVEMDPSDLRIMHSSKAFYL